MSLDSYAGLKAEIVARLRRTDLDAYVPGFVALTEAKLSRRLRVRQMIGRATATVTDEYSETPDDFAGVRTFTIASPGPAVQLAFLTPDQMDARIALHGPGSGGPRYYTVAGAEFRYHPSPAGAFTGALTYWKTVPALSEANPSNWLLADHPDAYLIGGMEQANLYLKTFDIAAGLARELDAIIAEIQARDDEALGATLTPTPSTAFADCI